jgi:hypothetical protein
VLADQLDRVHYLLMGHLVGLHMTEQHLSARLLVIPGLSEARFRIPLRHARLRKDYVRSKHAD